MSYYIFLQKSQMKLENSFTIETSRPNDHTFIHSFIHWRKAIFQLISLKAKEKDTEQPWMPCWESKGVALSTYKLPRHYISIYYFDQYVLRSLRRRNHSLYTLASNVNFWWYINWSMKITELAINASLCDNRHLPKWDGRLSWLVI